MSSISLMFFFTTLQNSHWNGLPACQSDALISEISVKANDRLEAKLASAAELCLLLTHQF